MSAVRSLLKRDFKLKAAERKQLSREDLKRYDKLTVILAKLKTGEQVYTSDLTRWLRDDYKTIAERWEEEKQIREQMAYIPDELKEYEAMLSKPIFYANRRDSKGAKHKTADHMDTLSINFFVDAIRRLEEILTVNPSYTRYLDREVEFSNGNIHNISHDEIGVPRLITSRSAYRQGIGQTKRKINEIRIEVVEDVLYEIASSVRIIGVEKTSDGSSNKLQELLKTRSDDDFFT
jgi:hypothetical protein